MERMMSNGGLMSSSVTSKREAWQDHASRETPLGISPVQQKMGELGEVILKIQDELSLLREKLAPVLSPAVPTNETKIGGATTVVQSCPIEDHLQESIYRVGRLGTELAELRSLIRV